jgi:1-acyl-sn-glycerol-3-phosphate acyltransferase
MNGDTFALGDPRRTRWFYFTVKFLTGALLYRCYGLRVRGRHRLPRRGGVILASTHQSFMDPVILGVSARRPLAYLARESLFRSPAFSLVIHGLNAIPVSRDALSPEALRRAVRALRAGWPLVVFPEGTRTEDGSVGPLRRGIALLAARAGVPVTPVRIAGAFQTWPRHRKFPRRRGRIAVAFEPLLVYDRRTDTYDSFVKKISRALRGPDQGER